MEKVEINAHSLHSSKSENEHQRHLSSNLSTQHELTDKDMKNDDLPSTIMNSNSIRKNVSPKNKNRPKLAKNISVKKLVEEFDQNKKMVRRNDVKLSPKFKFKLSPKSKVKKSPIIGSKGRN